MSEVFKTEFRGYNKQDVIDYIADLNAKITELKSQADRDELELSRIKADSENKANSEADSELRKSIYAEAESDLREQLEREFEEKYKQATHNGVFVLRDELDSLREKAALYDEQKEMLAELMIKAKTDAQEAYNAAQEKTHEIMSDTLDKLIRFENDYEEMKKNVLISKSEMDTRLTTIRHYLDDFTQYLDIASGDISNTVDNFKENI